MRAATLPVAGRLRSSFRAHAKSEERARHGALPGADSSLIARATGGSGGASPSAGTHGLGGPYPHRAGPPSPERATASGAGRRVAAAARSASGSLSPLPEHCSVVHCCQPERAAARGQPRRAGKPPISAGSTRRALGGLAPGHWHYKPEGRRRGAPALARGPGSPPLAD